MSLYRDIMETLTPLVEALNQLGTLYSGDGCFLLDPLTYRTSRDWKTSPMEDSNDWMIDANGFYVATRSFLIRRGFCCANQCRNCPYINWRNSPTWKPLPAFTRKDREPDLNYRSWGMAGIPFQVSHMSR